MHRNIYSFIRDGQNDVRANLFILTPLYTPLSKGVNMSFVSYISVFDTRIHQLKYSKLQNKK